MLKGRDLDGHHRQEDRVGEGSRACSFREIPKQRKIFDFYFGVGVGARKFTSCDLVWDSLHDKEDGGSRMGP